MKAEFRDKYMDWSLPKLVDLHPEPRPLSPGPRQAAALAAAPGDPHEPLPPVQPSAAAAAGPRWHPHHYSREEADACEGYMNAVADMLNESTPAYLLQRSLGTAGIFGDEWDVIMIRDEGEAMAAAGTTLFTQAFPGANNDGAQGGHAADGGDGGSGGSASAAAGGAGGAGSSSPNGLGSAHPGGGPLQLSPVPSYRPSLFPGAFPELAPGPSPSGHASPFSGGGGPRPGVFLHEADDYHLGPSGPLLGASHQERPLASILSSRADDFMDEPSGACGAVSGRRASHGAEGSSDARSSDTVVAEEDNEGAEGEPGAAAAAAPGAAGRTIRRKPQRSCLLCSKKESYQKEKGMWRKPATAFAPQEWPEDNSAWLCHSCWAFCRRHPGTNKAQRAAANRRRR